MRLSTIAIIAALASGQAAQADIVARSPQGFVVEKRLEIAAKPDAVWQVLVAPSRWWNPEHSWSGDARNLTLDPRAGGCFCERLPNGGGVEHMRVIHAAPAKLLRMAGALGPLQGEALAATLSVTLTPQGSGTVLTARYGVGGYMMMDQAQIAPAVDGVIGEQFARQKSAAETH
jgi:uncharacterized protein YndB with AHSA1/START domain